jgi:hypothetical protein
MNHTISFVPQRLRKHYESLWVFATFLYAVCITAYAFSDLFTHPENGIVELGGDGIKNIYTYVYQSWWGKGYWFTGMNYPFGEHVFFTDGFPLLSILFATFHHVTPETALAVMWRLIECSYILSIVFIYLTLRKFGVRHVLAFLFSGVIGIFTPQLFRIVAHFSLSISCVIPMTFYWTLMYHESKKWRYALYVGILALFFCFIHPYFSALIVLWSAAYAVGYLLFMKGALGHRLVHAARLPAAALAVFVLFTLIVKFTDPVKDRPIQPFGYLSYLTGPLQLVTGQSSAIWKYLHDEKYVLHITDVCEGYDYLGITAMLVGLVSLVLGIVKKRRGMPVAVSEGVFSPVWVFVAFSTLAFSMGIPFIFKMEWLLDYLSVVKQLRALGRFGWIFYDVFSIYAVVMIDRWYGDIKQKRPKVGMVLVAACFTLWGYEAWGYTVFSRSIAAKAQFNTECVLKRHHEGWNAFLAEKNHTKDDFEAILLYGMINVGTEKYWVGDNRTWLVALGIRTALQTHLPIIDNFLSRSSWSIARSQLKLSAGEYVDKPFLKLFRSGKPLLMLHVPDDPFTPDERYFLRSCDSLGVFEGCGAYVFYPQRQLELDQKIRDSIGQYVSAMKGADTVIGDGQDVCILHFDQMKSPDAFFGTGAKSWNPADSIIAEIPVHPTSDGREYEVSGWFLLERQTFRSPNLRMDFFDAQGKNIGGADVLTKIAVDHNDLWSRPSLYFKMPGNCTRVVLRFLFPLVKTCTLMDEVVLRPADNLTISKAADGAVMVNNHKFR